METNQPKVEETEFDIIERELQLPNRPKRKRKKVPFAVWLEQQEMKTSAENIEQEVSPVMENGSITQPLEVVDQKGDRPTPDSEPIENNLVLTKTWSEEHAPVDQEIYTGSIEKQNKSLVSGEESTAGVQDTTEIAEKEQPSMSEEQPPRTRRNKKKKIPFSVWLETHAPVDQSISSEITGMEDTSLDTKQETISVQQETSEKEQPLKSGTENFEKRDTSLPEEDGVQDDSLKRDICTEKLVIPVTQLVTEKNDISKPQRKLDQKGKKQSKAKRIKKTPLLWKSFPEPDATIDLSFFTENTDINNGLLSENQSLQAALPSRGKKTFWKTLPKSETHVDITFIAENIETQNVSMAAQKSNEEASLKKESFSKKPVISTTQLVTNKEAIFKPQETQEQRAEKRPSTTKLKDNNQTRILTEVHDNQTENVQGERLTKIQNVPHSSEKTTTQPKCMCAAKFKETELQHIKFRKYLMNQLDEMFDTNKKLSAKLKEQKDLLRKVLSERHQSKKPTVSVQTQTDSQDNLKQKPVSYQSASTQTEMEDQETSSQLKPVLQTVSTQTEMDELQTRSHWKPVCRTASTQTEVDVLESRCQFKPDYQTISTQTELHLLLQEQSSQTQQDGQQDGQTKVLKRSAGKKRRESAKKAASDLETLSNEMVSEANREHQDIPKPEPVGDQRDKNEIYSNETTICKLHQATEEETICTTQQGEDQRDERKATKKSKRKNQRKAAMKAACELETLNKEKVSVENKEQEEVSMLEIVGDQRATIIIEDHKNKTVIDKLQQASEDEMVPEKQPIGDQQVEKRPLTKSKCKKKRKTAVKAELETNLNPIVTDQNLVQNTETPKPDVETAPEIPQTALQQIEIKPVIVSEDVTDKDPVVLTEKLRTSPPQTEVTVNEDLIQRPQQSETQPSEESDEQIKVSEEEEKPKTKISLWRRFKKAVTPSCLRQFKDRRKGQTA